MNQLLLLPEEHQHDNRYLVQGDRAQHVLHVLKVKPGSQLHVGVLNGPRGRAEVIRAHPGLLEINTELEAIIPERPQTRVILAVPRPKVLRRLLPQLTAFALNELILLRTWRVQKSYLDSEILQPNNLRPLIFEGMMQACLTHEPKVRFEPRFRPFVEDKLEKEIPEGLRWIAHPRAPIHVGALHPGRVDPCTVAFGPEGGFLDDEIRSLERAGFVAARLAAPILKVETACIAALAQLELRAAQLRDIELKQHSLPEPGDR